MVEYYCGTLDRFRASCLATGLMKGSAPSTQMPRSKLNQNKKASGILLSGTCLGLLHIGMQGRELPPNILILLADQWRAQACGYAGDPKVKTPPPDGLSRPSANFLNAISS